MAVLWMPLLYLVAAVCGETSSGTGNFPLDDCSTDEMDILFLYDDDYVSRFQAKPARYFANDIIASSKTTRDVQFYQIMDTFSSSDPTVNVSSWHFSESFKKFNYTLNKDSVHKYNSVNETIPLKIQFVKRLFAEMSGVRENATHVAVVFLDGRGLSFDESRSVPDIVQRQDTDIKIFVVVLNVRFEGHLFYLRDTLLVGSDSKRINIHLTMAICNRCSKDWFLFKQSNNVETLSCYFLYYPREEVSSLDVSSYCLFLHGHFIAAVETEEELLFLKKMLSTYLRDRKYPRLGFNGTSMYSVRIAIGLGRDTTSLAKRFHWLKLYSHVKPRPIVVNHWLPGKPSDGFRKSCGSWQFYWIRTGADAENDPKEEDDFVDGWVDVDCEDELNNFGLCEIALPRRADFPSKINIKPPANKIVNQALAKGNFLLSGERIVSVSANVGNNSFPSHLVNESFPLFECGLGIPPPRYISYLFVCDGFNQCSNRRDEMLCAVGSQEATENKKVLPHRCNGVNCEDGSCLPVQWVKDGEVDCYLRGVKGERGVNDESEVGNKYLEVNVSCAFICNDDQCVLFSQLNDSIVDCKGPEGPLDESLGKLERANTCQNVLGHPIWAPRCVYVRDGNGAVLGCRDMSHLKGCTDFECPAGYIKCPNTYCIPQHYVLDGTVDCPSEEDEKSNIAVPCTDNFACWESTICLHPDLVCDEHPDCPHQDDEVDCHVTCPNGLRCISGVVTVSDYRNLSRSIDFTETNGIRFLNLSHVDLSYLSLLFSDNSKMSITVIAFSNCSVSSLNTVSTYFTNTLQHLDLSHNRLQSLHKYDHFPLQNIRFLNLSYNKELTEVSSLPLIFLETLDLSHTSVTQLSESFIESLLSLKHLNMSFTKITKFHKNTFPSRLTLLTLDLRGLALKDLREDFFNGLTVSQDLYTDSFELCCPQIRGPNIQGHACHAPDDAISSCYNLVAVGVQRVLLWVVAVLAVLGNMTVIVYRVIWDRSVLRTGYGLFVTNLGISDFIMGVYLFIIAGADVYYRGVYVLSDKTWRESGVCRLAGFLATLSCETSTFFVFLITLDRFLVMKFPFGQIKFNTVTKMVALILSWIIGFLLSLTPIVFRFEIYSSNAMCLGLPLTTERLIGWEFSFAVFIVLNFCLFLLIAYGQKAIFQAMSENRVSQTASRRAQDITVAKQLSRVALSNFLCWFPVGLMGLLSLGGHEISNDVYAWTTVIVLPINSAANPLLYTIPALMAKWERFKLGET